MSVWPQFDAGAAMLRLAHAHVAHVLRNAGVPHVFIKGPSLEGWLLQPGERSFSDVDVLLPPSGEASARRALLEAGFVDTTMSNRPGEFVQHARTFRSSAHAYEVDVHREYPGLDTDPVGAWTALYADRVAMEVGHRTIPVPSPEWRALILVLTAARAGTLTNREVVALQRAVDRLSIRFWNSVAGRARKVQAVGPLRAGLTLADGGAALAVRIGLHQRPSAQWLLTARSAPPPAIELAALSALPWRARLHRVAAEAFPSPSFMRKQSPSADHTLASLLKAYARRWMSLIGRMPGYVSAVRTARREARHG